jgi:hypothetical protein
MFGRSLHGGTFALRKRLGLLAIPLTVALVSLKPAGRRPSMEESAVARVNPWWRTLADDDVRRSTGA